MQKARNGLPPSGLTHMDLVRPQDLCDTLEIQSVLEAFAARLAAQRGVTSAQSDRLRQYVAAMEEIAVAFGTVSSELLDQYVNMSRRFHQLMVELAECSVLQRQVGDEFVSPYPFVIARTVTQARIEALRKFMLFEQDQHRSLIEAILQRNSPRAEALAQEHARFNQRFLALWGEETLSMVWPHTPIREQGEPA